VAHLHGKDRRVQQDILRAMGLEDYGFIDYDLTEELLSLSPDTPFEFVRQTLSNILVEKIMATIDKEGITAGLKLEKVATEHREIAECAQRIAELRNKEIEQVEVPVNGDFVDLRELWVTAHGYEALSLARADASEVGLTTNLMGLRVVQDILSRIGYQIKIGDSSVSGVQMSSELKKCVWWIIENRGRNWDEIDSVLCPVCGRVVILEEGLQKQGKNTYCPGCGSSLS